GQADPPHPPGERGLAAPWRQRARAGRARGPAGLALLLVGRDGPAPSDLLRGAGGRLVRGVRGDPATGGDRRHRWRRLPALVRALVLSVRRRGERGVRLARRAPPAAERRAGALADAEHV